MKKKMINIESDETFQSLIREIKRNYSPAAININWRMDNLLRENGYEWNQHEQRVQERIVENEGVIKSSRIVSEGRTPISEDKIAEIRQKRLEGHSVRSIAKIVGVGVGTVGKYIKSES